MPLSVHATLRPCLELLLFPKNHKQNGLVNCKIYDYQIYSKVNSFEYYDKVYAKA
jgi:hypothetical protein